MHDRGDCVVEQNRYLIIMPVRDEAQHLPGTLASIIAQRVQPARCVVVDDGSRDETAAIADGAAAKHPWILVVRRPDRGRRQAGSGVMEAFYAGLDACGDVSWDYLVKLDGDVTFEPDYFALLFERFAAEPRLGIAGGLVCKSVQGALVPESTVDPVFHVRGATKVYRQACWKAIGGLVRVVGWDTLDELKANMLGWSTRTFNDIPMLHHRPTGAAYGTWANWIKNGQANYASGYHPVFMLAKCASRALRKPYGVAALGLAAGYAGEYLRKGWRVPDPDLIRYFQRQQFRRLLGRRSLWN